MLAVESLRRSSYKALILLLKIIPMLIAFFDCLSTTLYFFDIQCDWISYMDMISQDLELCGCNDVERTIDSLFESIENSGMTYSNPEERCSIIVIGRTSSPEEFQSTFDHEKGHLAVHIALTDDISWISEEYQYLVGEIGRLMYPVAKMFLCEHCINELHEFKGTLIG